MNADKKLARVKARAERRKAEEDQTALAIGPSVAALKAKMVEGRPVTAAQLTAARSADDLQSLHEEILAQQAEVDAKARRERAVQVAADCRDQFQILRDDARGRAARALEQVMAQVVADLKSAYAPVQAATREMKAAGVSQHTIDIMNTVYLPKVDAIDVLERTAESVKRRLDHARD